MIEKDAHSRKVVYLAEGIIDANRVEMRIESQLSPGETRELTKAIRQSLEGQVTSLRYTQDYYPFKIEVYARESRSNYKIIPFDPELMA